MSGRIRKGEGVDLGPLVGRTRGFRTKELVPMRGGLGGIEMDEVPVVRSKVRVVMGRARRGQ